MLRELKWIVVLAALAVASTGCLNNVSAPPLQGPSELGTSLEIRANPFILTSDGVSSSVIECVVRDPNGQRVPNVGILFDIRAPGSGTIRGYLDLGVLAPQGAPRPIPGGPESMQSAAVTGADGVARVTYWAPFRTDQANDIIITIVGRPTGTDYRTAVARTADILLVAADRPSFPGGTNMCSFQIEPLQQSYRVGQQIFFTATQVLGPAGQPIARYEWDFGDGIGFTNGRSASYVYTVAGTYTVYLYTTESVTGTQSACVNAVLPSLVINP